MRIRMALEPGYYSTTLAVPLQQAVERFQYRLKLAGDGGIGCLDPVSLVRDDIRKSVGWDRPGHRVLVDAGEPRRLKDCLDLAELIPAEKLPRRRHEHRG